MGAIPGPPGALPKERNGEKMISSFYYLAAYTAAVAAGFSQRDSAAIARAARYTEDCAGLTAPAGGGEPESPLDQLLELGVFHYLPGDVEDILAGVNPAFYEGPQAASAPMLALVCRPDGRLCTAAVEYASRGMTSGELSGEAVLQRIGIVCHILAAAHLHQGFTGFTSPVINGVSGVMAADPAPVRDREKLLRAQTEPLETLFSMKPVEPAPDPAAGAAGCEQVEALVDSPASIFSYQSAWAAAPVSCVNPLRYAGAYYCLKTALIYLRQRAAGVDPAPFRTSEEDLLNAAVFFSGITGDNLLNRRWLSFFKWLERLPSYEPPAQETDVSFLNSFQYQVLQIRDWLWQESPVLSVCDTLFPAEEPAPAPEPAPEPTPEPAPEENGVKDSETARPALPAPSDLCPALPGDV